jgi:hypothetical protein
MLDDMRVLRDAADGYRAAATAAGVTWPDDSGTGGDDPVPGLVHRLFAVDHVAEQLAWLESQRWGSGRLFPGGGQMVAWPAAEDAGEALGLLSLSVGTPFPWRHQMPLFRFSVLVFTIVLAGDHEGEIWRYEIAPDTWDPVRASPSLAGLFTQWTRGLEAGVVWFREDDRWLRVGDPTGVPDELEVLRDRAPDLDPLAFPVSMTGEPLLRERQVECGVDLACVDAGFECQEELQEQVDAVRAQLPL